VVTAVAVPSLHRPVVGGVEFPNVPPCDDPQEPFTGPDATHDRPVSTHPPHTGLPVADGHDDVL
jgi:hypothetical protein